MDSAVNSFSSLHIDPVYLNTLQAMGITTPTSVQAEAIPLIQDGKDVVASSQTGSGKTLAYALPLLHQINTEARTLQVMIIVPTRELGMQIVRTLEALTEQTEIRVQQLIGGASIQRQLEALKSKPHIAVGTPGRVLELLKLRKLSMHYVRTLVVDEVDQVFELGGMKETESILRSMQRERQLLFFSATLPPRMLEAVERWMNDPQFVAIKPEQRVSETLTHYYYVCEEREKLDMLRRIVRLENPKSAIVFINDTEDMAELVEKLRYIHLSAEGLYGDAFKLDRVSAMRRFRDGKVQLLLATDVAARGLDLPEVTHVIHLDPATDADHYVHRSGRTGRMGRHGKVISIVTPKQEFIMNKFSKTLGIQIEQKAMYRGKVLTPEEEARMKRGTRRGRDDKRKVHPVQGEAGTSGERRSLQRPDLSGRTVSNERSGGVQSLDRSQGDPARGVRKSDVMQGSSKGQGARGKKSAEDRKNKGAPRWLKAKRSES